MNLKQRLGKKLKKTSGFTLIEMLIVVAIIAILVVVSIPMVSSSLDKAKTATDDANMRAAKAAAMIQYMTDGISTGDVYYYNADTGKAQTDTTNLTGYNQMKQGAFEPGTAWVKVTINTDGTVSETDGVVWDKTAAP